MKLVKVEIEDFAAYAKQLAAEGGYITKIVAYVSHPDVKKLEARREKKRKYSRPAERRLLAWFTRRFGRAPTSHKEFLFATMWFTDYRDDPYEADRRMREARRYFVAEMHSWVCPCCGDRVRSLPQWVIELERFAGRCEMCVNRPAVSVFETAR